jgi:isocitrate dehydrogenase kinase/phosphatase
MKSGNVVEYRIRLVNQIGAARVEALEQSNEARTFDIDYLRRVKRIFSRRARHYKRLRGL